MRSLMPTPLKDVPPTAKEQKDFDETMLQAVALGNLALSFMELALLLAALQSCARQWTCQACAPGAGPSSTMQQQQQLTPKLTQSSGAP